MVVACICELTSCKVTMAKKMVSKRSEDMAQPSAPSQIQIERSDSVIIYVNNRVVECKRRSLNSVSPYLEEQSRVSVLEISIEPEVEDSFIQYLKTGHCVLQRETLNLLTYAAHKYKMMSLLHKCEVIYLSQLIPMNCLESLLFAETHGCETLARKALALALQNFDDISKTEQFCHIGKAHLLKLLLDPALKMESEDTVVKALHLWSKYEENARAKDMEEMLRQVKEVFNDRLSKVSLGTVPSRTRNHSYSEAPAAKRIKGVMYQKQTSFTGVPCVTPSTNEGQVPAPTVVCLCNTQGDMQINTVTFSENQPQITSQLPVPQSVELGYDSAFSHSFDGIYGSGGFNKPVSTAFFDFSTKEWQKLPKMYYKGRQHHTLCHINERVYSLGGVNSDTGRIIEYIEKYNVRTKKWNDAGKLEEPVRSAQSVPFKNDIFVFGGVRPDDTHSRSVQCYSTATKKTETVCKIPSSGRVLRAITDRHMIYLITSNGDVLEFNPVLKNFKNLCRFTRPVSNFGIFHHNGFLYLFGGKRTHGQQKENLSAEVHNLDLRSRDSVWNHVGYLPRELSVISCSEAMIGIG